MYSIYADGDLVYTPTLSKDGYAVLSPKLTLELNKSGSLSFVLPPNNVMYDKLNKLKTTITVEQDGEEIFRGRVLDDERDYYNRKDVYCEGELSFLVDSIVRPYSFSGGVPKLFAQYVNNHNSQVEKDRQFEVGVVTVTDPNDYIVRASNGYPNSFDEMTDKLIDLMGGYFRPRFENGIRYLDYVTDYGGVSDQVIEFGINLLDITEYINAEDVFTVLIPLGAQQDGVESSDGVSNRLTITDINDGVDYIEDETAVRLFGRIWRTNTWDDVTLPSNLLIKGKEFLKSGIEMAVSLSIKAVDMHSVDVNTSKIRLGQKVRVVSVPHKLDKYFLCSKMVLDMENPDNSEYTFGVSFTSLTDKQAESEKHDEDVSYIKSAVDAIGANVVKVTDDVKTVKSDISIIQTNMIVEKVSEMVYLYDDNREVARGVITQYTYGAVRRMVLDIPCDGIQISGVAELVSGILGSAEMDTIHVHIIVSESEYGTTIGHKSNNGYTILGECIINEDSNHIYLVKGSRIHVDDTWLLPMGGILNERYKSDTKQNID